MDNVGGFFERSVYTSRDYFENLGFLQFMQNNIEISFI